MAYKVLARAYRSGTFDEVVGQEPTATTLKNAIRSDRVHHGYLFTGTRGVGKTSMAHILAKALNCLSTDAPTDAPCGTCDSCQAVAIGEGKPVLIDNQRQQIATLVIPDDATAGDTLHVICALTDAGRPPLSRYARVIVDVSE